VDVGAGRPIQGVISGSGLWSGAGEFFYSEAGGFGVRARRGGKCSGVERKQFVSSQADSADAVGFAYTGGCGGWSMTARYSSLSAAACRRQFASWSEGWRLRRHTVTVAPESTISSAIHPGASGCGNRPEGDQTSQSGATPECFQRARS